MGCGGGGKGAGRGKRDHNDQSRTKKISLTRTLCSPSAHMNPLPPLSIFQQQFKFQISKPTEQDQQGGGGGGTKSKPQHLKEPPEAESGPVGRHIHLEIVLSHYLHGGGGSKVCWCTSFYLSMSTVTPRVSTCRCPPSLIFCLYCTQKHSNGAAQHFFIVVEYYTSPAF